MPLPVQVPNQKQRHHTYLPNLVLPSHRSQFYLHILNPLHNWIFLFIFLFIFPTSLSTSFTASFFLTFETSNFLNSLQITTLNRLVVRGSYLDRYLQYPVLCPQIWSQIFKFQINTILTHPYQIKFHKHPNPKSSLPYSLNSQKNAF